MDSPERRQNDVEMALLRRDMEEMSERMAALTTQVHDLVAAWNTANNVVAFVKWLAGIATAIGVVVAAIKGFSK